MARIDMKALMHVMACKDRLTAHQFKVLRGQVLAGDGDGALKGLRRLLLREARQRDV